MNYKSFNLGDWIGHISGVIEDETTLDGNEMRDLVEFLSTLKQEPFKPMVEIDLYSVIKQKYIEREVLDKIRAEIDNDLSDGMIHKKTVLGIIDKYKAETEDKE